MYFMVVPLRAAVAAHPGRRSRRSGPDIPGSAACQAPRVVGLTGSDLARPARAQPPPDGTAVRALELARPQRRPDALADLGLPVRFGAEQAPQAQIVADPIA